MSDETFARELMEILYEEEARWASGEADHDGTLWSRVAYRMAATREKLLPSPVPKKSNVEQAFASRFTKVVKQLVSEDRVRFRKIGGQPQPHVGYNLHQLKDKDIALTEAGRAEVETWRAARAPAAVYVEASPAPSYYTLTIERER